MLNLILLQLLIIAPLSISSTPPPPPPPQVFQLKTDKINELKDFLMYKVNTTSRKKDALLENVEEVMGDVKRFTVEYSSEIVYATVVTNKVNQI